MKRLFIHVLTLWLALLVAGCRPIAAPPVVVLQEFYPAPDGVGDPIFPQHGNSGYDTLHYTLDLTVDVEHNEITGSATILATAKWPLRAFNLDLLGLTVEAISVNDTPTVFERDGQELMITLPEPLAAGAPFTTVVVYGGTPQALDDPDFDLLAQGWNWQDNTIFVVSEPGGAMTWYPVNNHPVDKATYTLRITVDEPYVVAANGVLVEEIDHGDQRTYVWEMAQPMASYLATVVIGDFVRVETPPAGTALIRHYFPADQVEKLRPVFANTGEMVDFYSDLIGEYPFAEYGVVVMPFPIGFALETQTLSVFGAEMPTEGVNAHELAHQWFGNTVTLARWDQTWLNEGFATYLQRLWMEHKVGRNVVDKGMRQYHILLSTVQTPPPGVVQENSLFAPWVYERGAWVLHALRLRIGDELFWEFLRTYYTRFKHGVVTTDDFIAVANEVSGQDLTEFLNAWLYDATIPPIPEE